VFPNRVLRRAGWLSVADDGSGGEEVDLSRSEAFAMVDHQVAHVYVDHDAVSPVRTVLESCRGVDTVLGAREKAEYGIDHPNAGDIVLVADPNAWFQYYWWDEAERAPSYATDMDIHAKPGFDPCELFFGDEGLASLDPSKVGGSHGRVDEETMAFYGLGGPAVPAGVTLEDPVAARRVAPTITELLGFEKRPGVDFELPSLLSTSASARD
jgi:hypothetical protein